MQKAREVIGKMLGCIIAMWLVIELAKSGDGG
jgi:hypothetical protein